MSNGSSLKAVYFLGIGGIGMSALARYFKAIGVPTVKGYDLTPSSLTHQLEDEGIEVHYTDLGLEATKGLTPKDSLIVFTPAVPNSLGEMVAFRSAGFHMVKRAEALGHAVEGKKLFAVAGTHGKTTTSSLLTHLLHESVSTSAFLGGISSNINSNVLLSPNSENIVAEADEYDRSFLWLHPYLAIVTATSPDHLDIYGSTDAYKEGFTSFINQIVRGGTLIYKKGSFTPNQIPQHICNISYSSPWKGEKPADVYSDNVEYTCEGIRFDWHFPRKGLHFKQLLLHTPFAINIENATAAIAAALIAGSSEEQIRKSLASFKGVKRRFEVIFSNKNHIYIDDYAHHPEELVASISSLRKLYPNDAILGIFQPHLYSRTRDFYHQFASALAELNDVILLPIYPAREEPIEGITSDLILRELPQKNKFLIERDEVVNFIEHYPTTLPRIIVTLGAGNIDRIVLPLQQALKSLSDE